MRIRLAAALALATTARAAAPAVAIMVSGHLRTVRDQIDNFARFVLAPNAARGPGVDVFYHLWANHSDACHNRTLRALGRFAADVTSEDHACSWAWGNGFMNQWHGVMNAFERVEVGENVPSPLRTFPL